MGFYWVPGSTPLHKASNNGQIEVIQKLLLKGANINAQDSIGRTPLICAIDRWRVYICYGPRLTILGKSAHLNAIKYLIDEGADVNIADTFDIATPLHKALAYCNRNIEIISLLISAGADVNFKNGDGETPLHSILLEQTWVDSDKYKEEEFQITKLLVSAGADIYTKFENSSLLDIALQNNKNEKIISYLTEKGLSKSEGKDS